MVAGRRVREHESLSGMSMAGADAELQPICLPNSLIDKLVFMIRHMKSFPCHSIKSSSVTPLFCCTVKFSNPINLIARAYELNTLYVFCVISFIKKLLCFYKLIAVVT